MLLGLEQELKRTKAKYNKRGKQTTQKATKPFGLA
jgi:hypothetical protein